MDELDRLIAITALHYNGAIKEEDIYWTSKQQIQIANTPNVPLSQVVVEDVYGSQSNENEDG